METETPEIKEESSEPKTDKGVAVIPKVSLERGEEGYIVPTTVEEAARMAKAVIIGGFAPDSYKDRAGLMDPNKVMLGIMAALEAGLPPLYGLRQIAIINGRPSLWGDAAMALVQSRNVIVGYTEEQIGTAPTNPKDLSTWPDDYGWKVIINRKGQAGAYEGVFTVGMAKRAQLWLNPKKIPWMQHPDRMLKIRARAFPLRDGFADALAGLAIREEVEDMGEPAEKAVAIDLTDKPQVKAPPMEEANG